MPAWRARSCSGRRRRTAAAANGGAFGAFAAAFGFAYGGFVTLLPAFATDLFGRRAAGGTIGVLNTSRGLAVLAATPAVAMGTAAAGGYALPLVGAAALGLLGTVVLAMTGTPSRGAQPAAPARPYRAAKDRVGWTKP